MKNSLPSSIIIVDKNNNIINWNKKAEEILGLKPESSMGKDLFELDITKKELVLEKIKQFEKDKMPVTIKSISVKDKQGDIHLTNISHIPMFDNSGEFQGSMMILEDISDTGEIQAELKRKDEDLEKLESRFKDVYNKLQIANRGQITIDQRFMKLSEDKQREMENIGKLLENKKRELDLVNDSIASKTGELGNISVKIEEGKSALQMVESELTKRKTELESATPSTSEALSKALKEKLKIYDEIDKSLGITDDNAIKTKKIEHEKEEA